MKTSTTTPAADLEWRSIVPVARALDILGYRPSDLASMTLGLALGRAAGAWDANERESHVAWSSIAAALR
jgi:hypothetical protein